MTSKTATPRSHGRFCWYELNTTDPKKAAGFYGELLGWKSREMDMGPAGTYTLLSVGDKDVAGFAKAEPGVPPHWLPYVTVTDVDASLKQAQSLGVKALTPAIDVPNVGRFAALQDPQGAVIAAIRLAEEAPESDAPPAAGNFCWTELLSTDPAKSLKVYGELFGWKTLDKDMGPMGTYHIQLRGERQAAGIMKSPIPGAPSVWLSYVAVANVDASAARAAKLGAKVMMEAADIPGIGRFAVIQDPQGAAIALFTGEQK